MMTELELRQRLIQKMETLSFQQLLFLEKQISTLELCFPETESNNTLATQNNPYPLRGLPIRYIDPTEPVALESWEILQ